jgi:hypothetical protein
MKEDRRNEAQQGTDGDPPPSVKPPAAHRERKEFYRDEN